MGRTILILLGLFLAVVGVILIYDARILTKKFFSFGDQNEGAMGIKIFGFFFAIAGAMIILCNS